MVVITASSSPTAHHGLGEWASLQDLRTAESLLLAHNEKPMSSLPLSEWPRGRFGGHL